MTKVNKIIHQIWYQGADKIPKKYSNMQDSWKIHHPQWLYKCWDHEEIKHLIHRHYPAYEELYDNIGEMILQIDLGKYFILHHHGGVYVDMDVECLRPLDSLIEDNAELYLPEMRIDPGLPIWVVTCGRFRDGPYWNNEFLASKKEHPFWLDLIAEIARNRNTFYLNRWYKVLNLAGPSMVTRVAREKGHSGCETTRSCPVYYFEPCDMYDSDKDVDLSRSYGIHRFANSWVPWHMRIVNFIYYNPRKASMIAAVLSSVYLGYQYW